MNDYERIAAVIRHLDEHQRLQPSLDELAGVAKLSVSHFHRLFHRWAGITPKDFLQCLTAEAAKARLRDSANVLEAALDSGLSGPGRLHDLLVTIEGASPGEYRNGGLGVEIEWGWAESPFGACTLGWTARGLCHLVFHDNAAGWSTAAPAELRQDWPRATLRRDNAGARRRAATAFEPDPAPRSALHAFVRGTSFQLKVWRALVRIPPGCVTTYRRVAEAIGHPAAARAVGAACGANPVAWLIPCHRVIRETGVVQGYRWGNVRKQALLAWESGFNSTADPADPPADGTAPLPSRCASRGSAPQCRYQPTGSRKTTTPVR